MHVRLLLLCLVLSAVPTAAQTGTTALYFDSQPGDHIGQGVERTWSEADLVFSASASVDRTRVTITANAPGLATPWTLAFASVGPLAPGLYESATRYPFQQHYVTALNVSGAGRSCNALAGRFRIHEIVFGASGAIERFAADFEQHCEGATPALFGAIRYRSTRASLDPFDGAYPLYALSVDAAINGYVSGSGIDCGAGRSDCAEVFPVPTSVTLTATPNPGYVFLGWAGVDCVGEATVTVDVSRAKFCRPVFNASPGGPGVEAPSYAASAVFLDGPFDSWDVTPPGGRSQFVFLPPYARIVIEYASPRAVTFRIHHPTISEASGYFAAASGETLAPGLYAPVAGDPFAVGPSSQLRVGDLSCAVNGGRFRIHEIAFTGATLTALSVDFEVPCAGGGMLTGSLRHNAARASLLPFDGVYPSSVLAVTPTLGGYVTSTAGIDCGDGARTACEASFAPPSVLSLQAIPSPGYEFFAWGGSCAGSDPALTIHLMGSARCAAIFHPVADAPSHSFGDGFLVIERFGATRTRSVWVAPTDKFQASALGFTIQISAAGQFSSGGMTFGLRAGRITPGEYYAFDDRYTRLDLCADQRRGFFKVYEVEYNPDGTLASFAADFEAHCSGDTPYIAGAVRYRAARDIIVPFDGAYPVVRLGIAPSPYGHVIAPGIACMPGGDCSETYPTAAVRSIQAIPKAGYAFAGWYGHCARGSGGSYITPLVERVTWCEPLFRALDAGTPQDPRLAAGSFTIRSQPGDSIGGGVQTTSLQDQWSAFSYDRRSLIIYAGLSDWLMEFRVPSSGVLGVGTYAGAVGMLGSAALPGLSVSRIQPARSCPSSQTTGRFTIHEIRFASLPVTMVASLALDFEQRCGDGPVLRGSIRYNSSRPVLEPFAGEAGHTFARFDLTGDQSADLLWLNRTDGRLVLWHLSGVAYTFNEPLSIAQIADTNWQIAGVADADSDGYNDLYWQNEVTGALAIWYMRNLQVVSTKAVPPGVADTNWRIRTVADVDRDGHPDLIWHHRLSGHIAVWYMTGGTLRSSQLIGPGQVADTNWTIVGAGDANGDGRPDLYWHHLGTGQLAVWYMDGARILSSTLLTPSAVADTNWRVRGIADLNRDGAPDLIWQNVFTSEVAVWLMSGSRIVSSSLVRGPVMTAADWLLVGPR